MSLQKLSVSAMAKDGAAERHLHDESDAEKKEVLLRCLVQEMSAALANVITSLRLLEAEETSARSTLLIELASRGAAEQQALIEEVQVRFAEDLSGLARVEAAADERVAFTTDGAADGEAAAAAGARVKTLVLIDPDALSRALMSQCVAGQGWRVLEAENGDAGLELVLKHQPAVVVCAVRAPKRNGLRICRSIRKQTQLSGTRVVLTSVREFGDHRDTALTAGADEYLIKPIEPAELVRTLERCSANGNGAPKAAASELPSGPTTIRFWGVRGSIPTPGSGTAHYGGNTSCVEVRVGEHIIVLDAGSGIRRLGQALMREFGERPVDLTMLVTHTHWDHIQGFPFFLPAYCPRVNIRILGYEGAVHGLRAALFEQMQSAFFPVGLNQMASRVTFEELHERAFDLGGIGVTTMFANHPGICLGYRLATRAGDIVYLPDHEAYERNERERQRQAGQDSRRGLEHARARDEQVVEFLRGADVLIADSQYDVTEYPARLGWGHTCAEDTVDLAMRAGVKQLFLFHHDPDHDDEKLHAMVARAEEEVREHGSTLAVSAAREGAEYVLAAVTAR